MGTETRVAVVTGAASGMGRAFATRYAEEGMRVVMADIEAPALAAAAGWTPQARWSDGAGDLSLHLLVQAD